MQILILVLNFRIWCSRIYLALNNNNNNKLKKIIFIFNTNILYLSKNISNENIKYISYLFVIKW